MDVRAVGAVRAVNAFRAVMTLRVAGTVRVAKAAKQWCERYQIPKRIHMVDTDHTNNKLVNIVLLYYLEMARGRG